MLTHKRLAEIKARLAAATPGPWEFDADDSELYSINDEHGGCITYDLRSNDADFIIHAPEDIALLLEVVEVAMNHPDFTLDNGHIRKRHWSDDI